jgi:hypothetical protein
MAFAMAGGALDDGHLLDDTRGLRIVRIGVVFGMDGDHRLAAPAGGAEAADEARNAAFDLEAGRFEQFAHQAGGFHLLHSQFSEIEDAVVEGGDGPGIAFEIVEAERLFGTPVGTWRIHDLSSHCVSFRWSDDPLLSTGSKRRFLSGREHCRTASHYKTGERLSDGQRSAAFRKKMDRLQRLTLLSAFEPWYRRPSPTRARSRPSALPLPTGRRGSGLHVFHSRLPLRRFS